MEIVLKVNKINLDSDSQIGFEVASPSSTFIYRVRPEVSSGTAYVYDSANETWVLGTLPWTKLPSLSEKVLIKVNGVSDTLINLKLNFQNVATGGVVQTNDIQIYGEKLYLSRFNSYNSSFVHSPSFDYFYTPRIQKNNIALHPYVLTLLFFSIFLIFTNRIIKKMLLYSHAYLEKMVANNTGVPFYICFILTSWSFCIQ